MTSAASLPARATVDPPALPDAEVVDVRCRVFRAESVDGIAMSFAPLTHRVMVVVEVELADGSVGMGESWANYPSWGWRERTATIAEGFAPLLRGRSFDDPAAAHHFLKQSLLGVARQWGAPGPVYQAISGVDIALWHLAAVHAGVSLAELLGGASRSEMPVYASSLGPDGVADAALDCLRHGFGAVKVKAGFDPDRDLSNVGDARRVLGDEAAIFVDANQAWTLEQALAIVPRLRDLGVAWVEEPLSGDRVDDLSRLHALTGMSIATGENVYGADAFEPYLIAPGIDVLQPDLTKVGGVTEYLAVSRRAAELGKTVNPHLYNGAVAAAATIQVAAACPTTGLIEWDVRYNPLRDPLGHLLTDHGTVLVGSEPGLGAGVDLSGLAEFEEDR